MDLQHRLARQTVNIAISKAIEDMENDTKRSIRNLIDLALLFSKSENQKKIFNTAKKVVSNPENPYNMLVSRMVSNIDNDTIKGVGMNLGYSSMIYGAKKLRNRQEAVGHPLPWFLILDFSHSSFDCFPKMENLIREKRDMGIYSYIVCPCEEKDIIALCEMAKGFDECFFVVKTAPSLITDQTARTLGKLHNTVVSVHAEKGDLSCPSCRNAFMKLKENLCFYGFHLYYNEDNREKTVSSEYISQAIEMGNLFGVYIADKGVSDICRKCVYDFVCNERGETGQPLILLEWFYDIHHISQKVLASSEHMATSPFKKTYIEYEPFPRY